MFKCKGLSILADLNDHQIKELSIVRKILPVNTIGNLQRTVWRICLLMFKCKGLNILADFLLIVIFLFKVLNLNDYDKLYLLMCKWRIIRLFNPLCYTADVTSVEDLEKKVRANLDDIKQKLPAWSQSQSFREDLETIKNLIEDSKTVRYENLPSLLVSWIVILVYN